MSLERRRSVARRGTRGIYAAHVSPRNAHRSTQYRRTARKMGLVLVVVRLIVTTAVYVSPELKLMEARGHVVVAYVAASLLVHVLIEKFVPPGVSR